jgi:hypothetical protein
VAGLDRLSRGRCPDPDVDKCGGLAGYGNSQSLGAAILVVPLLGLRYEL